MFGERLYDPSRAYTSTPIPEQLEALQRAVEQGKVRSIGLSNESPWGLMQFVRHAIPTMPTIVSLQNAYRCVIQCILGNKDGVPSLHMSSLRTMMVLGTHCRYTDCLYHVCVCVV